MNHTQTVKDELKIGLLVLVFGSMAVSAVITLSYYLSMYQTTGVPLW